MCVCECVFFFNVMTLLSIREKGKKIKKDIIIQ